MFMFYFSTVFVSTLEDTSGIFFTTKEFTFKLPQ